jgi:hypothetical protein
MTIIHNPTSFCRNYVIIAFILLFATIVFASCIDNDKIRWFTMKGEVKQLKQAQKPGAYLYSHTGKLVFSSTPVYPVFVFIESDVRTNRKEKVFARTKMDSGDTYTLHAELKPGTYFIRAGFSKNSELCCNANNRYWGAFGPHIRIESDGRSKTEPTTLRHQLVMKVVAPLPKETVKDSRPTLQWQPVYDAAYYEVGWHCWADDCPRGSFELGKKVTAASYTFEKPLPAGFKITWNVHAFNANNEGIAYYAGWNFFTPKNQ